MRLNPHIRGYLLQLVKPSNSTKQIQLARWALRIIERGYISEFQLKELENMGYKYPGLNRKLVLDNSLNSVV